MEGPSGSTKENTGRWTAEEHRLFLQGLELHGKGWKKIAGLIQTRTVVQIRTHAQKYFQKLAKARASGEGDNVHMEGRGASRRRRNQGNKRKAITSIAASTISKKTSQNYNSSTIQVVHPNSHIAPYLEMGTVQGRQDKITNHLEAGLFNYLTPLGVTLTNPAPEGSAPPMPDSADTNPSPVGVNDLPTYEFGASEAKAPPAWYTEGHDVDVLLGSADDLNWLEDNGGDSLPGLQAGGSSSASLTSVGDLASVGVPTKGMTGSASSQSLTPLNTGNYHSGGGVFDSSFDEQGFVSAFLGSGHDHEDGK
mmetsp:Transcript_3179/g.6420  ORF Transcript_3179/g.6420 Transcript_3179/m.6420 type:complete len:308 (-) Transcript_3179:83-1006(-)|eukprot:CAMPEP_0118648142 /NCGR_PEP_ID=MMETSP0785-20121206/8994_1 /TAXON_ID=91992 /ORGANISM="Bolidomonas pacifica, Strain CCMP 1866" /LENGTH=307 /DNA_ID=CAMNT_0006540307 /DNA_START=68 /DNA_END=991 /DNA_ORIENTATION=+